MPVHGQRGATMATSKVTGHGSAPGDARGADLRLVERCRTGELGAFEERARAQAAHIFLHQSAPLSVDDIALGQSDDAGGNLEKREYVEVLTRLRHHAFVRRDDEQRHINSACTREHSPDEAFVPWHIHDTDRPDAVDVQRGESKINRDPAPLFLRKPVGIDSSERSDERSLSMIDVTGGSEYHAAVQAPCSHTPYALSSRLSPRCSRKNSRKSR